MALELPAIVAIAATALPFSIITALSDHKAIVSRLANRVAQTIVDVGVLTLAFALAFALRFDFDLSGQMFKRAVFVLPYAVSLEFVVLNIFGVPRFAWRYVGLREVGRIALATGAAASVFLVFRLIAGDAMLETPAVQYAVIPVGVIVINATLMLLGTGGVRVLRRLLHERHAIRRHSNTTTSTRILLIGAGRAGVQVARELKSRPDLGLHAVGFVDNDPMKLGSEIHGLPVLGASSDLTALCKRLRIEEVVITIASASGAVIRELLHQADEADVTAKIIPGISDILDGRVNLSRIRTVSIEDLLGREAVHLEPDLVGALLADKTVLVTGAGGSIGSELCRQIARLGPDTIVLVERAEPALFQIMRELRLAFGGVNIEPALCDVTDLERLTAVFQRLQPHAVFHAAAHKHVPLMEWNPGEAIKNNVFGTRNVADVADRFGVDTVVLVSTDKAVNPTSVMGATKRIAELYVQGLSQRSTTRYVSVRFGNVLGSTGSVIPIFQEQIRAGGPVTVTHPEMKRYFMTIPEASQLVMQAGAMGRGGEIFVLDMGEPVKIVDLAYDLISLSGLEPGVDVKVEFCGIRDGEKMFEELGFDAEKMAKTRHKKIFTGRDQPPPWEELQEGLERLKRLSSAWTREEVDAGLRALVPEMIAPATPPSEPKADTRAQPSGGLQGEPQQPIAMPKPA